MTEKDLSPCEFCTGDEAEIFPVTGEYCLRCSQKETDPDVQIK